MTDSSVDAFRALIRKLDRLEPLSDGDRQGIAQLPHRLTKCPAGTQLVHEGAQITECCILLQGYAFRHKETFDGQRQIVSFHMAGDILDVQHLLLPRADHGVETLTDSVLVCVRVSDLRALLRSRPNIAEAFWRDALIEASVFREWVLNVGQRDALARVAHMLCEFAMRRDVAGLGGPERFELPMMQKHIGEATGLTAVHVNRMMRTLREQGILGRAGRNWKIADWERLQKVGDFRPGYLHAAA